MKLAEHPTVKRIRQQEASIVAEDNEPLDADWLRQLVFDAGDVDFVQIDRHEIGDQRDDILRAFPRTKTLISYIVRMNREPIRSPARRVANLEFHHVGDEVNEIGRRVLTHSNMRRLS